jgi:hypothetical protein
MIMLRIHFETPVHGWMLVTFETGEESLTIDVSNVPIDALLAFTNTVLSFANWGEGWNYFGHGSATYAISLRRNEKQAILEVFEIPYSVHNPMPGHGTLIFTAQDTPDTLLVAFWRGLRNLEARFDKAHWKYEFPAAAVEQLGKIVKGNP